MIELLTATGDKAVADLAAAVTFLAVILGFGAVALLVHAAAIWTTQRSDRL